MRVPWSSRNYSDTVDVDEALSTETVQERGTGWEHDSMKWIPEGETECVCRERAARRASFRRLGWGYLAWRMTPEQSSRGSGPPWGLRRPCARTLNSMCLLMTTLEWGEYRQLWGIWECREEKSWKRLSCWEERELLQAFLSDRTQGPWLSSSQLEKLKQSHLAWASAC